jgi:hypothetical protein
VPSTALDPLSIVSHASLNIPHFFLDDFEAFPAFTLLDFPDWPDDVASDA